MVAMEWLTIIWGLFLTFHFCSYSSSHMGWGYSYEGIYLLFWHWFEISSNNSSCHVNWNVSLSRISPLCCSVCCCWKTGLCQAFEDMWLRIPGIIGQFSDDIVPCTQFLLGILTGCCLSSLSDTLMCHIARGLILFILLVGFFEPVYSATHMGCTEIWFHIVLIVMCHKFVERSDQLSRYLWTCTFVLPLLYHQHRWTGWYLDGLVARLNKFYRIEERVASLCKAMLFSSPAVVLVLEGNVYFAGYVTINN